MWWSVILYILNYILVVLPLIVGTLVNLWTPGVIFNVISMIVGVIQDPVARTLIRFGYSIHWSIISRKQTNF
jgi:hypothetical protein